MGFQPPILPAAAGWYVAVTPADNPDPEAAPKAIASNVPIADADLTYELPDGTVTGPAWPTNSIAALPSGGIVVVASLPTPEWRPSVQGTGDFKPMNLPLRLADAEIRVQWEGQPNPNVLQLVIWAEVVDRYVEVKAHFGSQNPPRQSILATQGLLNLLQVPAPS